MPGFLIIQTAFIGDVVLATAIAEKLHSAFPEAGIDMLVRQGNEQLLAGHPFIGKVWVWNKKRKKTANLLRLAREIRAEKYDEVINLQRFFSTGLLTVLSGAKVKRGFDKNPLSVFFQVKKKHVMSKDGHAHETERNQELIQDITDKQAARPALYPPEESFARVKELTGQTFICCAPASVWFTKQYPEEYWSKLISKVPHQYKVYLMGGPADHMLCERIGKASQNPNAINLCGQLSFLDSAALMSQAAMNYVNDSAPMHFASAVNAPVTAIYCSTVTQFGFGPLSDKRYIVEIEKPLYCRPCGLHGYKSCPQTHFKCARDIPHNRLIEILNEC